MDLIVLNHDLEAVSVIDSYESLIWTDRYLDCGDFELYAATTDDLLQKIKMGYYLTNSESEHVMVVERIQIEYDAETGNHVTISGRSLESILDRRIVWGQQILNGNLQDVIRALLDTSIINPTKESRKISNFVFKETTDPTVLGITISAQYTGENVYEAVRSLCAECGIGYKILLTDDGNIEFELYSGVDRSYDQSENSFVIFSPSFDNLLNSNYVESSDRYKNVALIGGEGEGANRKYASVGDVTGLERRELFVDARDISSSTAEGGSISDADYQTQLQQRGKEKLSETKLTTSFEGEGETTRSFVYGRDFYKGDIVQVANEYGHESKARVLEVVMSEDANGFSVYPTFGTLTE